MNIFHTLMTVLAVGVSSVCVARARAAPPLAIETVTVGNPGNAGDPIEFQGVFGAVNYVFAIGKYEVTSGQYAAFLDAVAATDPYGLYDTRMWTRAEGCKIERTGAPGRYSYVPAVSAPARLALLLVVALVGAIALRPSGVRDEVRKWGRR